MKIVQAAALAFCAFANAAHADDKIDCKSQELNQMQLDQCAGIDFSVADQKLNVLYRKLISKYDSASIALLRKAELAWLAYRDSECSFETNDTIGGSINSMVFTMCRTKKTRARIDELSVQINCQEGDPSCNLPVK